MSESLKSEFTIALDAMGGDLGPEIVILAAKESLEKHESLRIVFFGKEKELTALCQKNISDQKRINIVDIDIIFFLKILLSNLLNIRS